ncbi:MAG: VWA domain-containing protein [Herpetosiphon sp.]
MLLIPLLVGAAVLPRRLTRLRHWSATAIRAIIIVGLVASLAGAQFVRQVNQLTTVFLVDSSDSGGPDARARSEEFIKVALAAMPPGDQAGIIVFGQNALFERLPSTDHGFRRLTSVPNPSRTDIGAALELGLALLPADTQQRLVLLSDGGENAGNTQRALDFSRERHVPIDIVALDTAIAGDLAGIDALDAPTSAKLDQIINLATTIESRIATTATLRIRQGNQIISEQQLALQAGRQTITVPVKATTAGFVRFSSEIDVPGDRRPENKQAAAVVHIGGEPRVLIIGPAGDAAILAGALTAAHIHTDIVAPEASPTSITALASYDTVILANVAAGALPPGTMRTLPAFVRELGHGLIMLGGDHSFGIGNYAGTPVETALPVNMDVKDRRRRPSVAVVFVLDKSGSMAACHCNNNGGNDVRRQGGVQKVDIGKEAIVQASAMLSPDDELGVVTFDDASHWALPTGKRPTADQVLAAIQSIAPQGATNIRAGLLAAKESLDSSKAAIKHIVLLTDGWTRGGDNLDLAQAMRASGITLSTVAAGAGSAPFLKQLADAGGGRYYPAENIEDVPRILVEETVKVAGIYLVEKQFVPSVSGNSPILRDLTTIGWPQLRGYNATEQKPAALVVLQAADGDPLLAQWQYGLGHAVAWTSDLKSRWAADLVTWDQFGRFAAQTVAWTFPRQDAGSLAASWTTEGMNITLRASLGSTDSSPPADVQVDGTLIAADGTTTPVILSQLSPGNYALTLPAPPTGTYLVALSAHHGQQTLAAQTIGIAVPYSPEYRQRDPNPALLNRIASFTAGEALTSAASVWRHNLMVVKQTQEIGLPLLALVLLLLPLDIAVRRLFLYRPAWRAFVPHLRTAPAEAGPALLASLHRARRNARARTATPTVPPAASGEPAPSDRPTYSTRVVHPTRAETDRSLDEIERRSDADTLQRLKAARDRSRRRQ